MIQGTGCNADAFKEHNNKVDCFIVSGSNRYETIKSTIIRILFIFYHIIRHLSIAFYANQ